MHSINFSLLAAMMTFATSAIAFPQASAPSPSPTIVTAVNVTSPTAPAAAYATGWCTYHLSLWIPTNGEWLVQHEPYKVQIPYIKDANHNIIGTSNNFLPVTGASVNVNSALPYVFIVTSTNLDKSNGVLNFLYGDDFWNSSSPQTSGLGALSGHTDLGSQISQLDGGFTC